MMLKLKLGKLMKNIINIVVVAIVLALVSVGCRTSPIYNVDNLPITISKKHNSKDIAKAITTAGATLGWKMKSTGNGHIVGTLYLRDHVAKVDITFTKKSYSIHYKDSQNLKYDGDSIHSNYNGWVKNLERNISVQISAM